MTALVTNRLVNTYRRSSSVSIRAMIRKYNIHGPFVKYHSRARDSATVKLIYQTGPAYSRTGCITE